MTTLTISTKMTRGGRVPLRVTARCIRTTDGAGEQWEEVDVKKVDWLRGGEVDEKHIKDRQQLVNDFWDAAAQESREYDG
jgi:hypothetical protein